MNGKPAPKSVLFVCNMNQIRSPMAEFLVNHLLAGRVYARSAGLYRGDADGFMQAVMAERGIDTSQHEPETLEELDDHFVDLVVTLTEQAHDASLEFFRNEAVDVEFWPTANPSIAVGRREEVLETYRNTRNELEKRIKARFGAN